MQLFKLYHNEENINHLTNELKAKSRDLDKLEKKKNEIDQQLKSKKQENARFSREMASVEKKIASKVWTLSLPLLLLICDHLCIVYYVV